MKLAISILFLLLAVAVHSATVVGSITDSSLNPYGGTVNRVQFIPLSCPQAIGTNTVWPVNRTVTQTNNAFSVVLVGGLYNASIVGSQQPVTTVMILVPPNDTNVYQFNYCANLATNLGTFVWTNMPNLNNATGSNVNFSGVFSGSLSGSSTTSGTATNTTATGNIATTNDVRQIVQTNGANLFGGTFTGSVNLTGGNVVTNGSSGNSFGSTFSVIQNTPVLIFNTTNPFDAVGWQQLPVANGHYVFSKAGYYTNSANTNIIFAFNNSQGLFEFCVASNFAGDANADKGLYYYVGSQAFPTNASPIDWSVTNLSFGPSPLPATCQIGTILNYGTFTNINSSLYYPLTLAGYGETGDDTGNDAVEMYDNSQTNGVMALGGFASQFTTIPNGKQFAYGGILNIRGNAPVAVTATNRGYNLASVFYSWNGLRVGVRRIKAVNIGGQVASYIEDETLQNAVNPKSYWARNEYGWQAFGNLDHAAADGGTFVFNAWNDFYGGNSNLSGAYTAPNVRIEPLSSLPTSITNGGLNSLSTDGATYLDEYSGRGAIVTTTAFTNTTTSFVPTNTAAMNTVSNVLTTGAWFLLRNQRGSVVVQAYATSSLSVATNIALSYSNAATGFISTTSYGSTPAGILAVLTLTNSMALPDFNPNSMVKVSSGNVVPGSDIIQYK